uniref:Cystatin n=1 Tax=Rhipicephalus appendiculatus TaxID=34631 RepID=A0A131YBH2_RHIAP
MAASNVSVLLIVLLADFCEESVAVGGWIEVRPPNSLYYQSLARFTYLEHKPRSAVGLSFLVTQARWRVEEGTVHHMAFIVRRNNTLLEKCIAVIKVPHVFTTRRRSVTKFWCRPVA